MNQQRPYKRRILNLSVNRGMQFRMIGRITAILFICLLICGAVYYYFANQEVTASYKLFHIKARNFLDFLLPVVIGSFVVSLVVGIIVSLFFPKNYAGGLYGIERDLKKIIDGDLSVKIALRKGDAAQPLAGTINELVDTFKGKITQIQDGLSNAQMVCTSETQLPPEERIAELKKIHSQLLDDIQKLKTPGDQKRGCCS